MENIKTIFYKLKNNVPELSLNKGFGHCAYGSKLLYEELKKNDIQSKIIVINNLKDNSDTKQMRRVIADLISEIKADDPVFGIIKTDYIKRGNRLPKNAGHAVVLIDDTVWDITSEQFGLPNTYPFSDLFKWWIKVAQAEITLNNDKLNFYINEVKIKQVVHNPQLGMEEYGKREATKPNFLL